MAKTYTCNLCDETFGYKADLTRHMKFNAEHREKARVEQERTSAERERERNLENAARTYDAAHRPIVDKFESVDRVAELHGREVAYALYRQNEDLADDLRRLANECDDASERLRRDGVERVAAYGPSVLYGSSLAQNVSRIPELEAKVVARRQCLEQFAEALNVICAATLGPQQLAFFRTLADCEIVGIDATGIGEGQGEYLMRHAAFGDIGTFATEAEAKFAAVERSRTVVEQQNA